VTFSQRNRVAPAQKISFCFVHEALRARKFFAGLHPVFLLSEPLSGKTHISTSAPTRRARFTGR
jgi:hypothetical protein